MSKLVFIFSDVQGGVKTYNVNLTRYLDQKSVNYKVVTYSFRNSFCHKRLQNKKNTQLLISRYAKPSSQHKYLISEIESADVLICNDSFELEAVNNLHLSNKVVFILHGDLNHYANTLKNNANIIDLVICVSNGLKIKYERLFPELKFTISHPFLLKEVDAKKQVSSKLQCIFIGRFEYLKGADLFLELTDTIKELVDWTIITTSIGSEKELLEQIPSTVKIYKDIPNEKVIEILAQMDVLIFPSRSEGFGIAILEALNQGVIPIVLDIIIGIPDQIIDKYNGFIIKNENWIQDAPKYLRELITNTTLLNNMKTNAIEFVKNNFDSAVISKKFLNQIDDIPFKKDKIKNIFIEKRIEKILPEVVFRMLKLINTKIKYE